MRKEPARARVQLSVRFEPELYGQARQAAALAGVSLTAWIEAAMREKLEREGKGT